MKNIILTFLIISSQFVGAQKSTRAHNLFEQRAYLDAAELFLAVDIKNQDILEKLGDCYYFNTRVEEAAKWYISCF